MPKGVKQDNTKPALQRVNTLLSYGGHRFGAHDNTSALRSIIGILVLRVPMLQAVQYAAAAQDGSLSYRESRLGRQDGCTHS